ncbi:MAG: hypothetical protein QM749_17760 [Aquabacterium sp.]
MASSDAGPRADSRRHAHATVDPEPGAFADGLACDLRALVDDVREQVERMQTASSEIAQGNMDLSGRMEEAAAASENMRMRACRLAEAVDVYRL